MSSRWSVTAAPRRCGSTGGESAALVILCSRSRLLEIEGDLHSRGVRIVDEWGALITPILADFQAELAREPIRMRQSSDNA
jgi:hypothetical protein